MKLSTLRNILVAGMMLSALPACNSEGGQVHIKGKMLNMPGRTVAMSYDGASSILGNSQDITLHLDAEGCFDTIISLDAPAYYNISRNTLYLTPGDDLNMKISQKNKEAEFSGKGAEANIYLKSRLFPHAGSYLHGGVNMKENFESTRRFIDSMALARRQELEALPNVSKEFKELEHIRISADLLNSYSYYPTYANIYAQTHKSPEVAIRRHQIDSFYTAMLPEMKPLVEELNQRIALDVAVARSVLGSLMHDRQLKGWSEGVEFVPEIKELMEASRWIDRLNGQVTQELMDEALSYAQGMRNQVYAQELVAKTMLTGKLLPGQPAIDFSLVDIEGNACRLSDFKGKAIYIDFWATWCGPCVKESPHFEALAKEYADKEIVFLAVSMDNGKKTWRKYLEAHKKDVPQYHSDDPALKEDWCIKGIPRFVLIDKDFKISDAYAPRPSEEKAKISIRQLLE